MYKMHQEALTTKKTHGGRGGLNALNHIGYIDMTSHHTLVVPHYI